MNAALHIIATSDVHGAFFPYDFITLSPAAGSLARVSTYINNLRDAYGDDNVMLLDCGDMLQGGAATYLYNYIETRRPHPVAEMMHYLRYDAMTIGNHDIETGHAAYDRFVADMCPIPVLGGNVLTRSEGNPYFAPYTIVSRAGMRIAVIGLTTPIASVWVPYAQWYGMAFQPMVEAARKWLEHVRATENPDLVIGLFHSGYHSDQPTVGLLENASLDIAEAVPGFDIIIMGHDHKKTLCGGSALMINPGAHASDVAHITVRHDTATDKHNVSGEIVNVSDTNADHDFIERFRSVCETTHEFLSREIGESLGEFSSADSLHGSSAFMTLIHSLQQEITGAQISIAAPPSADAMIRSGAVCIKDMFTLYRYENRLCTVIMAGYEIKNYLEMSYDNWDMIMDSAQGIDYTVDTRKSRGDRVNILRLSDGSPFSLHDRYTVAINEYRANGGGDLMTLGAGIPYTDLSSRIIHTTSSDLRHHFINAVAACGTLSPVIRHNWHFIPPQA